MQSVFWYDAVMAGVVDKVAGNRAKFVRRHWLHRHPGVPAHLLELLVYWTMAYEAARDRCAVEEEFTYDSRGKMQRVACFQARDKAFASLARVRGQVERHEAAAKAAAAKAASAAKPVGRRERLLRVVDGGG